MCSFVSKLRDWESVSPVSSDHYALRDYKILMIFQPLQGPEEELIRLRLFSGMESFLLLPIPRKKH